MKEHLILLPGLMCDQAVWGPQMDALSDIALCSCADWASLDSLPAMAETVLRTAPDRFSIAGHSMGGRVALEIFRQAPNRVARMALLDTAYRARPKGAAGETEARGRFALLELARSKGIRSMGMEWLPPMLQPGRTTDAALVEAILEMIERKTPDIFEAQIRALLARPDASRLLGRIRCPTLVLCGREDGWSPVAVHEEMAAAIAGSELVVIPECGHMCTLERPGAVADAMRAWLGRSVPRSLLEE